jgi:hypothetical protein
VRCGGPPSGVTEDPEVPSVVLFRRADAPPEVLREVCAGVEEEGVPARVVGGPEGADAVALAYAAARESRLEVGVGLGDRAVAVHHAKLPERSPAQVVPAEAGAGGWRRAGRSAARIVKGLPLDG